MADVSMTKEQTHVEFINLPCMWLTLVSSLGSLEYRVPQAPSGMILTTVECGPKPKYFGG